MADNKDQDIICKKCNNKMYLFMKYEGVYIYMCNKCYRKYFKLVEG